MGNVIASKQTWSCHLLSGGCGLWYRDDVGHHSHTRNVAYDLKGDKPKRRKDITQKLWLKCYYRGHGKSHDIYYSEHG